MSLGGTHIDHYKDMFRDMLLHEAQQSGSRLEKLCTIENMVGNKTYFDKLGAVDVTQKTARGQLKNYVDRTFERRFVQEATHVFDDFLDIEDLMKYVANPQSDIVRAAVNALGRKKDEIIMDAIVDAANVQKNGAVSSVARTLTVAVNDHTYDPAAGSADVGLTVYKLKNALRKIEQGYGATDQLFVVAPMDQIMNLTTDDQVVRGAGNYRTGTPLEGPGIVTNLSGFLGMTFIAYEGTGVDSNADDRVFVLNKDAIKLGIFKPLSVEIVKDTSMVGNPDAIEVLEAIGAARMYEEFVVEIACNPIA